MKNRIKIDINRLHQLALEGKTERRQGRTFLACDSVVNQACLNQVEVIVCVVKHTRDLRFILPMLMPLLADAGLPYERRIRDRLFLKNYPEIRFIPQISVDNLRGIQNCLIVDFVDYL